MRREDVYELYHRIPPTDHAKVVLVLRAGFAVSVEVIYRFETAYVVIRGREAGTNDDGRAFFVPYDDVLYLKIDRPLKLNDLRKMYGEPLQDDENELAAAVSPDVALAAATQTPGA